MSQGAIDGREINALTINADVASIIYSPEGGYEICIHPGRTAFTLPGNLPFIAADYCIRAAYPPCTVFTVPASRGCVS